MKKRCPSKYRTSPKSRPNTLIRAGRTHNSCLTRGHGLGDQSLERQLLLLQVLSAGVLNLQLAHGLAETLLNLVLLATLELEGKSWVRDNLLDTGNVRLKLLLGLEALGEGLVARLELLGI